MKHKSILRKLIFSLALVLGLALGTAAVCSFADTYTDGQGIKYNYTPGETTASVASNSGASGNIIIPSTIEVNGINYSVTSIGNSAFEDCSSLTDVFIEENENQEIVDISNARIQNSANIWRYEVLADQTGAPAGKTLVKITSRDQGTGQSVTCGAMGDGYIIKEVPSGITLTHSCGATSDPTRSPFSVIIDGIEWTCTILQEDGQNTTNVSIKPNERTTIRGDVVIPSTVTCQGYKVKAIEDYAFFKCNSLTSVEIPSSVTSIGEYAFQNCNSLTSVTIPSSVTSIGMQAFWDCSGLTSVEIPSSVTSIGNSAFRGCRGLTSINFENPSQLTSIENSAFFGCISLTSVTIPSSVTSIGMQAFQGCSSLTSVTIPSSVTSIKDQAFIGCSDLTSVEIPSSVTSIGNSAFEDCSSLTSVEIPSSVTSIGNSAFEYCSSLTDVFIEENENQGIVDISNARIQNSANIWRYEVLADQTGAPAGKSLIKITSRDQGTGQSVACGAMGDGYIIKEVPSDITLTHSCGLPADLTQTTFDTTENGIEWKCTILQEDGQNTTNVSIKPNDRKTIRGDVVIPSTVTCQGYKVKAIEDYAFDSCSYLTSVTIPNSVTAIGASAFQMCSSLTSVTIPSSVTSIGRFAFQNCISLTSIEIPNSVTSIGEYAFYKCSNLTSVTFENASRLTSIENDAFQMCSSLTSVTIPSSVTSIKSFAFDGCSGLTSINFEDTQENPSRLTMIDNYAFQNCSSLTSVTIPKDVKSLGYYMFNECNSLSNVFANSEVSLYADYYSGGTAPVVPDTANIFRYEVRTGEDVPNDGKTHVNITEVDIVEGVTTPVLLSWNAMGSGYVIDSLDSSISNVTLLKLGDVDGSGVVDVLDLQMLYNHVAEIIKIEDQEKLQRAKITNDDEIDVIDLQALFNIIANS